MNARERFLETLLYGKPDRVPLEPGWGRKSTRENWHRQGLPQDVNPGEIPSFAFKTAGGRMELPKRGEGFAVNERMNPLFEEKVIEKREHTQIVQDWKGNICEISNEFTPEYLRNAIDFVTRRWIKCPVESHQDWSDMKKRYNPEDPARFPENPVELGRRLKDRNHVLAINFSGPFWQLREWVGFENLCLLFYDDPDFVREMIKFWENFVARLLEKTFQYVIPDQVHLSEDMAYKAFPMISPAMAREFLLPTWSRWGEIIRKAKVPVYGMDSDGHIGDLIPIWIEAGMNECDPIEIAAGNNLHEFRKRFGKKMAYIGGVDKRAMARGGAVIEREIENLEPLIRDGGFIPSCDHGVPPDVSWPDFVHYVQRLSMATGWMRS